MLSMLPTSKHQKVLVGGYMRQKCSLNMPIALTQLILWFYNEIFFWTIKGKALENFFSTPTDTRLFSKPFLIQNVPLRCYLFPNGKSKSPGYVRFGVHVHPFPLNVSNIVNRMKFYCHQSNVYCESTSLRTPTRNGFGWRSLQMKLDNYKHLKELNFCCLIDVLRITPDDKENKKLFYYKPNITIHKSVKLKWNIDNEILTSIKLHHPKTDENNVLYYYPKRFQNDNFCIFINQQPKIKLLAIVMYPTQFPENVKEITVEYNMTINYDDKKICKKIPQTHNYGQMNMAAFRLGNIDEIEALVNANQWMFEVNINILKAIDYDNNDIVLTD